MIATLGLALSSPARAEPQGTAALTVGVAGTGVDNAVWQVTKLHLGLRGDMLFGRSGGHDFGIGPYAELGTLGFSDVQLGAGASVLLPVSDILPIVVSGGGYGRLGPAGLEPGVAAELFWGSRSYNFSASYVMAAGLLLEARYGLGSSHETALILGAQLDLAAMSLPFVLLANAIRGGSSEARPVRP